MEFIKTKLVNEYIHTLRFEDKPVRSSAEFIDELNSKVKDLILEAQHRANGNKRNTLLSKDL